MPRSQSTAAPAPMRSHRGMVASACVLLALAWPVRAEFHLWVDPQGRGHLSNLPPRAFDRAGRLRETAHPWSLTAQHAALAARLAARDAALAAGAAVQAADEVAAQPLPASK